MTKRETILLARETVASYLKAYGTVGQALHQMRVQKTALGGMGCRSLDMAIGHLWRRSVRGESESTTNSLESQSL